MASVEQREATHPAGLTSLELFDKFKVLDEDKDSDEESFHLPMLDSEEDISSNKASSDTPIQNGESEDDILNKFDCVTTPEPLDPKAEESILNEDVEEENVESKIVSSENEEKKVEITQNGLEEGNTIDEIKTDIPKNDDKTEEKDIVDNKVGDIKVADQPENVSEEVEEKVTKDKEEDKISEKTQDDNMEVDDEAAAAAINEPTEDTKIAVTEENKEDGDKKEDLEEDVKENDKNMDIDTEITSEITNEDKKDDQNKEQEMEIDDVISDDTSKESTHTESKTDDTSKESAHTESKADDTSKESTHTESKADDTSKESSHTESVEEIASEQTPSDKEEPEEDKKDVLQSEKNEDIQDKTEEESTSVVQIKETANLSVIEPQEITSESPIEEEEKKADDTIVEIKEAVITTKKQSTEIDKVSSGREVEGESKVTDDTSKVVKDDLKKTDEPESDKKTENEANDSANSENLERDDLLDISVICDVDEDNAKAVADNASDGQTSEKSDNDEQDDKGDNEESENDQEENTCSSDKEDAMEFDDIVSNSNLPFEENSSTNDNVPVSNVNEKSDSMDSSDSGVSKEDVEMVDVLPKVIAGLSASSSSTNKSSTEAKSQTTEDKTENEVETSMNVPEEPVEYLDLDKHMAEQKKILDVSPPSGKRPLPQDDEKNVTTKKMRLSDSPIKDDTTTKKTEGDDKLKKLTTFESFMRTKIFNKKLTKSDLEQFCIQKICEVIMHKTELGELNQLVKKQEQVHEQLRRDIQQLTKQNRDLDIVNKKLMNELKTQNGKQKPLVPLKITRSVGLQVKLNVSTEPARKRPPTTPIRTTPPVSNNTTPVNNTRPRTVPQASNVVRQVTPNNTASPRKPPQASGSTTPILSQALQTPSGRQSTTPTNAPKRPPIIRPKPAPESANKPSNPGVIDLTDEDDRTPKTPGGANIKIVNKQMVTTSKLVNQKPVGKSPNNQAKMVNINQVKSGQVVNKGTPNRTVTTLPQGVRLTSTTTVKNGIAIPVTSTTGGPQLMYVVQPSSQLVTTTAQGGQKTVLLNFQPGNGILTSALNGSAVSVIPTKANVQVKTTPTTRKHPAPLPLPPPIQPNANLKPLLPKPHLSIRKTETGIILQWRMPYNLDVYESIASYQLFAYQETNAPPSTDMWRKVGDVKALALPMACTLTQFADKNKYYFAVRSVDVHKRIGAFSDPEEISL